MQTWQRQKQDRKECHLLAGHAAGEEPEEDGLDDEADDHRRAAGRQLAAGGGEGVEHEEERVGARGHDVGREEDEVLLVERAHAVVHPRAVVVHAADAAAADRAVVRFRRLEVAVARVAAAGAEARRVAGVQQHL